MLTKIVDYAEDIMQKNRWNRELRENPPLFYRVLDVIESRGTNPIRITIEKGGASSAAECRKNIEIARGRWPDWLLDELIRRYFGGE